MVFFFVYTKILNYFILFSLRNGELNVKNNTPSRKKNLVFSFFLGENRELRVGKAEPVDRSKTRTNIVQAVTSHVKFQSRKIEK